MDLSIEKIPVDTARAVRHASPKNQRYINVGDKIHDLLAGWDVDQNDFAPEKPRYFILLLDLATIFQFVEKLTDAQTVEAIRTRVDWKYALHLPLSYPGFDQIWLCRLRKYAMNSIAGIAVLQALTDRLANARIFDRSLEAAELVPSICLFNRIELVTTTMLLAVEALAVTDSAWLNHLPLTYLYEETARTRRTMHELQTTEAMTRLANSIGVDIGKLLNSIQTSGEKNLIELAEIQGLQDIWEKQYEWLNAGRLDERVFIWNPVDCHHCVFNVDSGL